MFGSLVYFCIKYYENLIVTLKTFGKKLVLSEILIEIYGKLVEKRTSYAMKHSSRIGGSGC